MAGNGAMASVELPAQQVREELARPGATARDVVVAVVASPQSTVIGGRPRRFATSSRSGRSARCWPAR
ncbi:mycocerosic acid synthase domain protein [Mycobacterium kansasii]|uniref:Mycocerosic acid synthase domain protein n=1 Tax=Mycobacterium kansasii TaxID=1768 RepID=A0A1V3WIP4_MYCKA|nr:mycocerosic acid synthase domain protein [Mycobacterium kansasii]